MFLLKLILAYKLAALLKQFVVPTMIYISKIIEQYQQCDTKHFAHIKLRALWEHGLVIQYKLFTLHTLLGHHCIEATIICGQPGHLELLPGEPSLSVHTI